MAGRGPAPGRGPGLKDPATRVRRNKPTPITKVDPDGRRRGPALPKDLKDETGTPLVWHPRTVAWWDSWRQSPMAKLWTTVDWDYLLDTALMHHTMWAKGRWEFASEVRLRVAKFGATPEDRVRLHLDIGDPDEDDGRVAALPAAVTDISSRRRRLTSAAATNEVD